MAQKKQVTLKDVVETIQSHDVRFEPKRERFPAVLGNGDDTDKQVLVPGRGSDWHYAIPRGIGGAPQVVHNEVTAPRYGLRVIIERDPAQPEFFTVVGRAIDVPGYTDSDIADGGGIKKHHQQHEFYNDRGGDDLVYVSDRQFRGCRVGAQATPDLTVQVDWGYYLIGDSVYFFAGDATVDLSGYVPAGGEKWVTLVIKDDGSGLNVGEISVIEGTNKLSVTFKDIPGAQLDEWAIAAVKLVASQTEITDWPDTLCIVDLRMFGVRGNLQSVNDQYKLADGQLPSAETTLYTASGENVRIDTIRLHNTHTSSITCTIKMNDRIIIKVSLGVGNTYVDTAPRALSNGDILEGLAGTANKIDYYIGGIEDVTDERLCDGQLSGVESTLLTVPAGKRVMIDSITLHNTHTAALDVALKADSRIIADFELGAGYTYIDVGKVALEANDLLRGDASTANKVDYYVSGVEENA